MLEKLAKRLQAQVIIVTTGTFEIIARAPKGYAWADNGQEEITDQIWEGETKSQIKRNVAERMLQGLEKLDN